LEEAIALNREALQLVPQGHPERQAVLSNLAASLLARYEAFGDAEDRESAIALHREAGQLRPEGHPSRLLGLSNLAVALQHRYKDVGMSEDLDEAIALLQEALRLHPRGQSDKPLFLNNLAETLRARYDAFGALKDIEEAITLLREALQISPRDDPNRAGFLNNLAASLQTQYEALGTLKDLEEAIGLHREALQLRPQGHTDRSLSLGNLANSLMNRYMKAGEIEDLEEAIALHREGLQMQPHGHPARSQSLNNTAESLRIRYEASGVLKDLEDAIALHQEALQLRPQGHPNRESSLGNLAISLQYRYKKTGMLNDLDKAIDLLRGALLLQPQGDPYKPLTLHNLANALRTRYGVNSMAKDLEEAIVLFREVLQLSPHSNPNRSISLNSLAMSLQSRYEGSGISEDLEESIVLHQEALSLQPHGHPDRASTLQCLARTMASMHGPNVRSHAYGFDIQQMALEAVDYSYASTTDRLAFAQEWADSTSMDVKFRVEMHRKSMLLLQQMLVINPDLAQQQSTLSKLSRRVSAPHAAETAILASDIKEVVTLLDLGRSVFLSTFQRYRTPLEDLQALDSGLADELKAVGSQLENLSMLHNNAAELPRHITALDHALNTQRHLIKRWDALILQIRELPGFQDFLGIPSYLKLQAAAKHGPIIFLNASDSRCDAIIMPFTGEPTLVHLPDTSCTKLVELGGILERVRAPGSEPKQQRIDILHILRSLWETVVEPIVDSLISLGIEPGPRSRIWLCPTSWFTMLPIHAAGIYEGSKSTALPELFVTSYISTATNLLRSMKGEEAIDTSPISSVLFVGHTGGGDLEGVAAELESVQGIRQLETTSLLNLAATPNIVIEAMKQHSWIHLSCHGLVDHGAPLNSHLTLEGGDLHVQDIIKARLENAEFAFLSACHSAAGSFAMPDESLHLTSALQFAGFRSVVGTMWEMYDSDAPELAKDFYNAIIKMGGRPDHAAAALHKALKRFRRRGGPERWAMFIHVGA
jgi:tetratricopeptide (TPR) repeat protein